MYFLIGFVPSVPRWLCWGRIFACRLFRFWGRGSCFQGDALCKAGPLGRGHLLPNSPLDFVRKSPSYGSCPFRGSLPVPMGHGFPDRPLEVGSFWGWGGGFLAGFLCEGFSEPFDFIEKFGMGDFEDGHLGTVGGQEDFPCFFSDACLGEGVDRAFVFRVIFNEDFVWGGVFFGEVDGGGRVRTPVFTDELEGGLPAAVDINFDADGFPVEGECGQFLAVVFFFGGFFWRFL